MLDNLDINMEKRNKKQAGKQHPERFTLYNSEREMEHKLPSSWAAATAKNESEVNHFTGNPQTT